MEDLDLKPGVSLLTQNLPADAVYFLKSGAVQVLVNGEMVAQIDKVQCFGEMSCLIPDTPASASVVTAKDSQLIRIKKDDFLKTVSQISKLWKMLFLQTSERVKSLNERLSEILHHLPQGLVKVWPDGTVSNDYSVQCTKFFQMKDIAGLSFPKLAFPDDFDKQQSWMINLGLLFAENNMSFEACAGLLESGFMLRNETEIRYFAMSYSPCRNSSGRVIAVDIGIEDITKQKELEKKNREAKLKEEVMHKIAQSPDSFLNFLALSEEAFNETVDFLARLSKNGPGAVSSRVDQLMRCLHSLKGISGVFSLQGFKTTVHGAESIVRKIKDPNEDMKVVADSLEQKLILFKMEKEFAQGMFDDMPADLRRRLIGVVFAPDEFHAMKGYVEKHDIPAIQKLFSSVEKVDSKKLVAQWPQEAQRIAESLGKSVQFNVAGEGGRISKDVFAKLDNVLVHLLRNGLDHGLEMPDERERKGKTPQGRITAMIDVTETDLMMAVEDDGKGLDREALALKARKNPQLDQSLIESYVAKGEEWRILLMPGFSTAKEVTDISGRGVGLDAVSTAITSMGGSLTIESKLGEGTCFIISVPI